MNIKTILWIIVAVVISIIVFALGIGLAILSALFAIFLRCLPVIIVVVIILLLWRLNKKSDY